MKPTNIEAKALHKYFKKILGYGNNCKCGTQGTIKIITKNLIEFKCKKCYSGWAFDSKITVKTMITHSNNY